jgi:hypothetical protein
MFPRKLHLVIPALLLVPILILMPAIAAANIRAHALADADATKEKAMTRLANEAATISLQDQQALATAIEGHISRQLEELRKRYQTASKHLQQEVGYTAPWISMGKTFWSGEEEASRYFQKMIDTSVAKADISAYREKMGGELQAATVGDATKAYQRYRENFNKILFDSIDETAMLGPLTKALVQELIARVEVTSRQLSVQDKVVDSKEISNLPLASMAALTAIIGARIARSLALTLGENTLIRSAGRYVGALLLGPLAPFALAGSVLYDIFNARSNTFDTLNKTMWASYHDLQQKYAARDFIRGLAQATVAGLEQQLQTDRRATRIELDRFFDGFLVQAKSPGYAEFIAGKNLDDMVKGFKMVAAAFGRDLIDVPYPLKYELASDLGVERGSAMLQKHGQDFVSLYSHQSKAVSQIIQNKRYPDIIADILQDSNSNAALLFYKRSLDRFGTLDDPQTDALILVHQLHPTLRPDDVNKDALTILGANASQLASIKRQAPQIAATTVEWVLRGQMSATLMKRLVSHSDAALLLSLPVQLGPDAASALLSAANEDQLVDFIKTFSTVGGALPNTPAVELLREDGPGHLKAYREGGRRTVTARHTLLKEYGGKIPEEADRTLQWLMAYTSVNAVHKSTIDNLRTIGIPGGLPNVLAIPTASMVMATGLIGPILIVLLFLGGTALAVTRFVFRIPLPFPRRRAIAEREMINVTHLSKRND